MYDLATLILLGANDMIVRFTCGGIFHDTLIYGRRVSRVRYERGLFAKIDSMRDFMYRLAYIATAPCALACASLIPICNLLRDFKIHLLLLNLIVQPILVAISPIAQIIDLLGGLINSLISKIKDFSNNVEESEHSQSCEMN